jgi:cytochrome P450
LGQPGKFQTRLVKTGVWMRPTISSDPAEILRAPDLDVAPYAQRITALSDRLNINLSATISVLNVIPLCQQRMTHPDLRRAMAALISVRSDALKAAIPNIAATRLNPLTQPGRVDMITTVIEPMVSDVISTLIGVSLDMAHSSHISRVFSQVMGVAKRRRLDEELVVLRQNLRNAFPKAEEQELDLKLSLAILGRDALLGTLGCSLHALCAATPGRAFCDIDWPDLPPRTGVPYIDRVALRNVTVGGVDLDKGDNVRASLADYESAADSKARLAFFGAGAHLCLGRALALDLWRAMTAFLQSCPQVPQVVEYSLRRDDVFHIPDRFFLEIFQE